MPVLHIKKNPKSKHTKPLIIVISKKDFPKAVKRNLIKRRIRAIAKPLLKNNSYTIIVKSKILTLTFRELQEEFVRGMRKHVT